MNRSVCAGAAVLLAALAFGFASRHLSQDKGPLFRQYADIGRHIATGEGYRSSLVSPKHSTMRDGRGDPPVSAPVLSRSPLHAYTVGISIKIFGDKDGAVLAAQGLELAAAAGVAAFVFFPLLGGWGALGAALISTLNPSVLSASTREGRPDLLFCALLLALNAVWLRRASARALGALAGLAWLAFPNFLLFLPVYANLAWTREERNEETFLYYGRALIALLIVVFPFAVYQLFHARTLISLNLPWDAAAGLAALGRMIMAPSALRELAPLLPFAVWGAYKAKEARPWLMLNGSLLAMQGLVFCILRTEALGGGAGPGFLWFAPTLACAALLGARAIIKEARARLLLQK